MNNLTLLQRGLLLVSFPIVCQMILVFVLCGALWEVESQIYKEFDQGKVATRVTKLSIEFTDALMRSSEGTAQLGEDGPMQIEYRRNVKEFQGILSTLRQDPEEYSKAFALSRALDDLDGVLQWAMQKKTEGKIEWCKAHEQLASKLIHGMKHMIDANAIFLSSLEAKTSSTVTSAQAERQISLILFFGLTLSVVTAVALGMFYAFGISRPLQHVMTNSQLMSERKPLAPELEGHGEVEVIDNLIHLVDQAIYESIANEEAMVDNAGDLICSLNEQFCFTSANSYSQIMLKMESDELLGKPLHTLTSTDQSLLADECLRRVRMSQETQVFELTLLARDGSRIETRWSCFWADTEQKIIAVVNDISEQKQIDRIKHDFEQVIGDELRKPLMTLRSQIQSLRSQDFNLSDEVENEFKRVERNLEKLLALVDEFADMQQLDATTIRLEFSNCLVCELEHDALELIANFAKSKKLEIQLSGSTAKLNCDRTKIVRVLVNLLSNAIKFGPPSSKVRVESSEDAGYIEIRIIDQGPGIGVMLRESLFEPFTQGNPSLHTGSGLGLSICRIIVEAHGGSIGVREPSPSNNASGATEGSEFWFTLPFTSNEK